MFLVISQKTGRLKTGMENGDGDEEGGRFRRRGGRMVQVTRMVNRAENVDGGRLR